MKPATLATTILLFVISAVHICRLVLGLQANVGGVVVPMWISVVAAVVCAGLGFAVWREHRGAAA